MTEWKSLSMEDDMCTVQSALARTVRLNFLGNGRLTSSAPFPPSPHTLWLHPQTAPRGIGIGYRGGR